MGNGTERDLQGGMRCLFLIGALCGWVSGAQATVLLFDQVRDASSTVIPSVSGFVVEQDYGDRVAGSPQNVLGGQFTYGNEGEGFTPNVVVDYFVSSVGAGGVSVWQTGYGDLTNVLYGNQNSETLNIRLTADAGYDVLLYDLDLAGWLNAGYTIDEVRVLEGGTTLFSQSDVLVQGDFTGPRHTSFAFASPLSAAELLIQIDYSNLAGTSQDNIGIDNVRFGQDPPAGAAPIPEPSTWLLFGAALAALPLARRRVQRRR
jgi:hypothetical protein